MDDEIKYWLAFSYLDGVGGVSLLDILEHFKSMKAAWHAPVSDWRHFPSLRNATIENLKEKKDKVPLDELESSLKSQNISFITLNDEKYPEMLLNIPNPPIILFVKGSLDICNLKRTLAVVGSRNCSFAAIDNTKKIISGLKNTDVVIVSGGARGIDTASHEAALEANVKTIAVLGSGFNFLYPVRNKSLFRQIENGNGALISEYYPHMTPEPFRFPLRNRIISGLSYGTLVAEAGLNSGALITARVTLEQGRELMCLPGMLNNPNTEGTHKLLKEGASLVTETKDVLNYLNWNIEISEPLKNVNINLNEDEALIYELVSKNPLKIDEIAFHTGLNINDIMVILTTLELKGMISQAESETYLRI